MIWNAGRSRPFIMALAAAAMLAALVAAGAGFFYFGNSELIYPGVAIHGVPVGGLTKEQAVRRLNPLIGSMLAKKVVFTYEGQKFPRTLKAIGVRDQTAQAVQSAYLIGRRGSLLGRLMERRRVDRSGLNIPMPLSFDPQLAGRAIAAATAQLDQKPQDAVLEIDSHDQIIIKPDREGRTVDLAQALSAVRKATLYGGDIVAPLSLRPVKAHQTAADLKNMNINGIVASYTTWFDNQKINRTYNVNVAADAINNVMIKPGEIFSFNRVVGPRSEEAGYKEALVIEKNKFVPGLGGGVCQVSSTLYNAVLRADMPIMERSRHSLLISYVPIGVDATVVYGYRDFRFLNNTGSYLVIRTTVGKNTLKVDIFGDNRNIPQVQIINEIKEVISAKTIEIKDPVLASGKRFVEQAGTKGYRTEVYRVVRRDGQIVKKEFISRDTYPPEPQIIRVGVSPQNRLAPPAAVKREIYQEGQQ